MKSTSLSLQFTVNDLNANYEVIGSSDNYSFQFKLGKGYELTDYLGGTASKIIPLKGNYGMFEVKVFAVNDIGLRSNFILDSIYVDPPSYNKTEINEAGEVVVVSVGSLTFDSLAISNSVEQLEESLFYEEAPSTIGDLLIAHQDFIGKDIEFSWTLTPPPGHPMEGEALSEELLFDPFFSGVIINLKTGSEYVDLYSLDENNSAIQSFSRSLNVDANDVAYTLHNYRNFSLYFDEDVFDGLNLGRDIELEIVAVNSFGDTCTGIMNASNPYPVLTQVYASLNSSNMLFEWESENIDYSGMHISVLGIPEHKELFNSGNLLESKSFIDSLNYVYDNNVTWDLGFSYRSGSMILNNDNIYRANRNHTSSDINAPGNDNLTWTNYGDTFDYVFEDVFVSDFSYSQDQFFGYKYYYTFQVLDDFSAGDLFLLSEDGIISSESSDAILHPYQSSLKISNLSYVEREDDFLFSWDITDEDGNAADLVQYKTVLKEGQIPAVLGLSGSLYDIHSRETIYGLTTSNNSISLKKDENGDTEIIYGIQNAKIFERFEYTREINNSIYGTGGFPEKYQEFNIDSNYISGDLCVDHNRLMFKAIIDTDQEESRIKPSYLEWNKEINYQPGESFLYAGKIYKSEEFFGPSYTMGLFNFSVQYEPGDLVVAPNEYFENFDPQSLYGLNDLVIYNNTLYKCLEFQEAGSAVYPDTDLSKWRPAALFSEVDCEIFEAVNAAVGENPYVNVSLNKWRIRNPENSNAASIYIDEYLANQSSYLINEWSDNIDFVAGDLVVYENDIWSGVYESGPNTEIGVKVPGSDLAVWQNEVQGEDIIFNYSSGDKVHIDGVVYKADNDNPVGAPIQAINNPGESSNSTYLGTEWIPYWQREVQYDDLIFGNIGIPQSGKRSVGLELAIVDGEGDIFGLQRIDAENPAPVISQDDFEINIDSESEAVKFNFNYLLGFQEKVNQVYLYRSSDPEFDITDARGFPDTGEGSNFVKTFIGAGDAIFGENVNTIIDYPPLPSVNDYQKYVRLNRDLYEQYLIETTLQGVSIEEWAENHWDTFGKNQGLIMPEKKLITGYYYKLLPFDEFGTGVLHSVRDALGNSLVNVVPKNFHSQDPFASNGPVVRAKVSEAEGDVPFPIINFKGSTIFENYVLNWSCQDNDIDFFEVWNNREDFDGDKFALITGNDSNETGYFEQKNNTGYRRIDGSIYEIGDQIAKERIDQSWRIKNARWLLDVPATSNNIEAMIPGATNQERTFWVRAVDMAGNKSPFTGINIDETSPISGLSLKLKRASSLDVSDFEVSMTEKFSNAVALVPSNPFQIDPSDPNIISWGQHYLFNQGSGYIVSGNSNGTSDKYIWWDKNNEDGSLNLENYYVRNKDGLVEKYDISNHNLEELLQFEVPGNNDLTNIYFSGVAYSGSSSHPAGSDGQTQKIESFNDNDFIIAKNTEGSATIINNSFVSALIGTANIAEASIVDAKINNIKANKILAETISGQDIQVWGLKGKEGAIRTRGFTGVDHSYNGGPKGFLLSGDGTFAFQAGDSSLSFDNNVLTLRGKIKQTNGKDLDFVDINVVPASFNYVESNEGFELESSASVEIEAIFRNSSMVESDQVYFKMNAIVGGNPYKVFDYGELSQHQTISGFTYDSFQIKEDGTTVARAVLNGGFLETEEGFHDIITSPVDGVTGDSVVLYVSGENSAYERSATISRVIGTPGADGTPGAPGQNGVMGATPAYRGIYDSSKRYYFIAGTQTEPGRGDIVEHNDSYYICTRTHGGGGEYANPEAQTPADPSDFWRNFDAQFENVATDLLLTEDAVITTTLTVGSEVGSPPSYFKYDAQKGRLDMRGAVVNNTVTQDVSDQLADINLNGSASIGIGGTIIDGTSTAFTTDLLGENYIRLVQGEGDANLNQQIFTIVSVDSDVQVTVKESSLFAFTSADIYKEKPIATFIGGGYNNSIDPFSLSDGGYQSLASSVIGGAYNEIIGRFSFIGNGFGNTCYDNFSAIVGGYQNTMPKLDSANQGANFIGAGQNNTINGGTNQSILGGSDNTIENS